MAVRAERFEAARAVRPVVVAARLALDRVARADFFAVVAVDLAPDRAVRAVLATPERTLRAVWSAPSVAVEAVRRTPFARFRAVVDPVGETFGLLLPRMRAIRSCTALMLPWAMPLRLSPTRSTTPAMAPPTVLPGGASGRRGCGCVGAVFFARQAPRRGRRVPYG